MSVIDAVPLIRKYELGEEMTNDEREVMLASLYFSWRATRPTIEQQITDVSDAGPHPLDEALGNIHAIAIHLHMIGQHSLAVVLAEAHEAIQDYLVRMESK
jgi:hypothetical protein